MSDDLENPPWIIIFVSWIWIVWSKSYIFNFKSIAVPCQGKIFLSIPKYSTEIIFFYFFSKNKIETSPCQVGLGRANALWFRVLQVMVCRGRRSHLYWHRDSVHALWHFEPGSSKSQINSERTPTAKSWKRGNLWATFRSRGESGRSVEIGPSRVKVNGRSESGRSFDEKWTVPG